MAINTMNQIFYSATSPSASNVNDGDLWFDSASLRLNVRHSSAWVYADNVIPSTLKSDLLIAVNAATDFATLKSQLVTALT
jgi:hypothetical protein